MFLENYTEKVMSDDLIGLKAFFRKPFTFVIYVYFKCKWFHRYSQLITKKRLINLWIRRYYRDILYIFKK